MIPTEYCNYTVNSQLTIWFRTPLLPPYPELLVLKTKTSHHHPLFCLLAKSPITIYHRFIAHQPFAKMNLILLHQHHTTPICVPILTSGTSDYINPLYFCTGLGYQNYKS